MIVVFGSNVLDLFFDRANMPARDKVEFLDSHDEAPGGKGANQAVAAVRAGSEVHFFGALGKGGHGRQMKENLLANGIDVSGIEEIDAPSGLAVILVDKEDGTHRILVSHGANKLARQSTVPAALLKEGTTVLVQGELPIEETEALIARAKKSGARTVMNFAPATQPLSKQALRDLDIIVLNEHESDQLAESLGVEGNDKQTFAWYLYQQFDLIPVITLGGVGSLVCTGSELLMISPLNIKPVDTVGAGDAYTGYLCSALDQGKKLEDALRWASVAGSLACTKIGAQTALPHYKEVESRVSEIRISRVSVKDSAAPGLTAKATPRVA